MWEREREEGEREEEEEGEGDSKNKIKEGYFTIKFISLHTVLGRDIHFVS